MSNSLRNKQFLSLPRLLLSTLLLLVSSVATAQNSPPNPSSGTGLDPLAHPPVIITPLTQPTLSPGVILLMELDGRFAQAVASGGGKAFASWFADDAVTLNNGRPAVYGHNAIAAQAQWDPKTYQLTWVPQGAQMGPSNDMGFTWGHYDGRSIDKNGQPVVTSGRYITMWKKLPDGSWKVAMDASADDASPSECCTLPKP
jgi:ketosteroid isomerase-like protein